MRGPASYSRELPRWHVSWHTAQIFSAAVLCNTLPHPNAMADAQAPAEVEAPPAATQSDAKWPYEAKDDGA